jgi:predicted transcriptional regulator
MEITELLFRCGISPLPRAKVLSFFLKEKGKELTAREIERGTDLRQPEVSLALSAFVERKWVTEQKPKELEGKGRPSKMYTLAIPTETLFTSIESGLMKDMAEKRELLNQLRTAMISPKPVVKEHVPKEQQLSLADSNVPART